MTNIEQKTLTLVKFWVALFVGFLCLRLIYLNPWWGLMDDGGFIEVANFDIPVKGFWTTLIGYVQGDLDWGMFRPTLVPLIWITYWNENSPLVGYLTNFSLVLFSAFACVHGFVRSSFLRNPGAEHRILSPMQSLWAIGLLAFLFFPWTFFQFLFVSLQEKLVILGIALVLNLQNLEFYRKAKFPIFFLLSALSLFFAFGTKAQIVSATPLLLFNHWKWTEIDGLPRKQYWARNIVFGLLLAAATLALIMISRQGAYTSAGYSVNRLMENITIFGKAHLLLALAIGGLAFVWITSFRKIKFAILNSAPALSLLAFILMMLPWKFGGYILAFPAIYFAFLVIQFFHFAFSQEKHRLVWLRFSAAAVAILMIVGSVRSAAMTDAGFDSYSDLRTILDSKEIRGIAASGEPVFMGCNEPPVRINTYAKDFFNNASLKTYFSKTHYNDYYQSKKPSETYWIMGDEWCPIPSQILSKGHMEWLAGGKRGRFSYKLVKVVNKPIPN